MMQWPNFSIRRGDYFKAVKQQPQKLCGVYNCHICHGILIPGVSLKSNLKIC